MGNKQNLQFNNEELQAALKAINSLPTAKSWGGGAPIIEPSSEDIVIPAFTNIDLTVKGVDLSKFGIASGSFTPTANFKDISLSFDMRDAPKIVIIWHEEPTPMSLALRRAVFFNHPGVETVGNGSGLHHIARAEKGNTYGVPSLYEGHLYGAQFCTATSFKYEMGSIYSGQYSYDVMMAEGYTYKWIALA